EARMQAIRAKRARGDLGIDLAARELDRHLSRHHNPVSAVIAMRPAAALTIAARIARSRRGCVRTLTAAPTGDATSADANTIAAKISKSTRSGVSRETNAPASEATALLGPMSHTIRADTLP